MQDEDQGVNTEDDVKHGSPSPGTQAPDIEPHLNSFKNFGYQIASGMVRVNFQHSLWMFPPLVKILRMYVH